MYEFFEFLIMRAARASILLFKKPPTNKHQYSPGVTACQPIPWLGGDNRIPEAQHLWGRAAWPSGFAASQGTPS